MPHAVKISQASSGMESLERQMMRKTGECNAAQTSLSTPGPRKNTLKNSVHKTHRFNILNAS